MRANVAVWVGLGAVFGFACIGDNITRDPIDSGTPEGAVVGDASSDADAAADRFRDAPAVDAAVLEGATTREFGGHLYALFCERQLIWDKAKSAAEAMGGHLVVVTSSLEEAFVKELVSRIPACDPVSGSAPYLGAIRAAGADASSNGWTWVTGEPWSFTDWGGSEPNDDPANAAVASYGFGNLVWVDVRPQETRSLLVEFE